MSSACLPKGATISQRIRIRLDGELWEASCEEPLAPDDPVTVQSIDGLILRVNKDKGE